MDKVRINKRHVDKQSNIQMQRISVIVPETLM